MPTNIAATVAITASGTLAADTGESIVIMATPAAFIGSLSLVGNVVESVTDHSQQLMMTMPQVTGMIGVC